MTGWKPNPRKLGVVLTIGLLALGSVAAADPYAPIKAASERRREAAQQTLADWRARHEELTGRLKTLEKELDSLAAPPPDEESATLAGRLRKVEATLRGSDPQSFTSTAQFAQYDRLVDERAALKSALEKAQRERLEQVRRVARRTPQGAALADQWEALHVQAIAAENEAAAAQARRDTVVRSEANLLRSLDAARRGPPGGSHPARRAAARRCGRAVGAVPPPRDRRRRAGAGRAVLLADDADVAGPGAGRADSCKQGRYAAALEAYKHYFFAQLLAARTAAVDDAGEDDESRDGEATLTWTVFPPPTAEQIRQALAGVVAETVPGKNQPVRVEANLGQPGAIHWVFAAPGDDDATRLLPAARLSRRDRRGAAALVRRRRAEGASAAVERDRGRLDAELAARRRAVAAAGPRLQPAVRLPHSGHARQTQDAGADAARRSSTICRRRPWPGC